jgi:4-amino-4-deoxy-L-arabinose transferase-like glycosyltransferase
MGQSRNLQGVNSMEVLVEAFPFAFGVLLGVTWLRFERARRPSWPWAIACLALGAFATVASGEWRESPLYFLFDIGLVAAVFVATVLALKHWRRMRERS